METKTMTKTAAELLSDAESDKDVNHARVEFWILHEHDGAVDWSGPVTRVGLNRAMANVRKNGGTVVGGRTEVWVRDTSVVLHQESDLFESAETAAKEEELAKLEAELSEAQTRRHQLRLELGYDA